MGDYEDQTFRCFRINRCVVEDWAGDVNGVKERKNCYTVKWNVWERTLVDYYISVVSVNGK